MIKCDFVTTVTIHYEIDDSKLKEDTPKSAIEEIFNSTDEDFRDMLEGQCELDPPLEGLSIKVTSKQEKLEVTDWGRYTKNG